MRIITIFCVMMACGTALGETLDGLVQRAVTQHPTIRECESRIAALHGQWVQEGLPPNPTLSYMAEEMSSGNVGRQGVELSQEWVSREKRQRAQGYVSREIEVAQSELAVARRRVETEVRLATYHYLTLLRKREIQRTVLGLFQRQAKATEAKFQAGNAPINVLQELQIEVQKAELALAVTDNDLFAAWRALACAVGDPDLAPCALQAEYDADTTPLRWETFRDRVLAGHPEIAVCQARITAAHQKLDLERSRSRGNVTFTGGVAYASDEHDTQVTLGVGIPLRIFDRNQGRVTSAYAEIQAAQEALHATQLVIQSQLAQAYGEYANACAQAVKFQKEILPKAKEAVDTLEQQYRAGQADSSAALRAQRNYAELLTQYTDIMGVYWRNKVLLEAQLVSGTR